MKNIFSTIHSISLLEDYHERMKYIFLFSFPFIFLTSEISWTNNKEGGLGEFNLGNITTQ